MALESNEFIQTFDNNKIRPYTVGMKRHNETLATIVVFNDEHKAVEKQDKENFLDPDALTQFISPLQADVINFSRQAEKSKVIASGRPRVPGGTIVEVPLDGINPFYGVFNNFSLLSVNEASEQIVKLHVNFGSDWNAFFMGEKPKVYQFGGFFLDSPEYPYYQEFMVAYEKYLSGRKAVENGFQTTFVYDGRIIDGYILNISTQHTAADQLIKNFTFTVLVSGSFWIRTNMISTRSVSNKRAPNEWQFNGLSNTARMDRQKAIGLMSDAPGAELNSQEPLQEVESRNERL